MNSDTDRCEDPILLIREACSRAMIGYVPSELRTELIEEIVAELPDFFRQPLRADHEEKDTQADNAG